VIAQLLHTELPPCRPERPIGTFAESCDWRSSSRSPSGLLCPHPLRLRPVAVITFIWEQARPNTCRLRPSKMPDLDGCIPITRLLALGRNAPVGQSTSLCCRSPPHCRQSRRMRVCCLARQSPQPAPIRIASTTPHPIPSPVHSGSNVLRVLITPCRLFDRSVGTPVSAMPGISSGAVEATKASSLTN
jgi:hypothetical protein